MKLLVRVIKAVIFVVLCSGAIGFLMEGLQEDSWISAHGLMDGAWDPVIIIAPIVAGASFILLLRMVNDIIRGRAYYDRNH